MQLSLFDNLLWGFGTALKLLLCFLVFYRGLHRRLPFFALYTVLLVAEVAIVWGVYRQWGFTSRAAWYTAWSALALVLLARGLVVAELCRTSLRAYPAIWSLARKLLTFVAVVVVGYAAVITVLRLTGRIAVFILPIVRGLEMSIAAILVALLAFGLRYRVALGSVERNIALGLGVYSAFQVINNVFVEQGISKYFHWWNSMRVVSFEIAMLRWIIPLRNPLLASGPSPVLPKPVLIDEQVATSILGQLLDHMRAVRDEVKRLAKSFWR